MEDLFEGHNVGTARPLKLSEDVVSTATYGGPDKCYGGPDKCYRYKLKRVWDPSRPLVMWLMMNPSVATEYGDDRTVAKCQRYARAWGYGGILVGNTFAYRCTDQLRLLETPDPIGPENDKALLEMAQEANKVIAAYGTPHHKALLARGPDVVHMLQQHGITVDALRLSKTGRPCHPLYLPASLLPEPLPTNLVQS